MLFHCHAVSTHSIQCGLLEGLGGTKRVHIAVLFTPASWIGWKKPCEKKSSTTDTEEVHNANSFPNTTDCFHHNEGKQPLLLSSTSTNNTLTKPPNPRFVPRQNPLDRLNAPRVGKKSSFSFLPFFPPEKEKYNKKGAKEKRKKWPLNSSCKFLCWLNDLLCVFTKTARTLHTRKTLQKRAFACHYSDYKRSNPFHFVPWEKITITIE